MSYSYDLHGISDLITQLTNILSWLQHAVPPASILSCVCPKFLLCIITYVASINYSLKNGMRVVVFKEINGNCIYWYCFELVETGCHVSPKKKSLTVMCHRKESDCHVLQKRVWLSCVTEKSLTVTCYRKESHVSQKRVWLLCHWNESYQHYLTCITM